MDYTQCSERLNTLHEMRFVYNSIHNQLFFIANAKRESKESDNGAPTMASAPKFHPLAKDHESTSRVHSSTHARF
jgi:hypothetical protein